MVDLEKRLMEVVRNTGKYPIEAFQFVFSALEYTIRTIDEKRHVSGQELLEGIRRHALEEFGFLAHTVFGEWKIDSTEDFGRIVFILVENDLMKKTDEDSIEDFRDVYDFEEALVHSFKPDLLEVEIESFHLSDEL